MKKLKVFALITASILCYLALISCSQKKDGSLFYGALGLGDGYVVVSASIAATQHISLYDVEGNFIKVMADYTNIAGTPRGLAPYGAIGFLAAIDATEEFTFFNLIDGIERTFSNTLITGNFFDVTLGPDGHYYAIESNTIERFDVSGTRFPVSGAAPAIATTIGACTLNVPTGLAVNADDELIAVNNTGNTFFRYTLSSTGASACATVALAGNPRAVIRHTNGNMYVTTTSNPTESVVETDSQGGNQSTIWSINTAIIRDAFDLAELPNGNLLVASTGTDSIVEIMTDGTFVRTWARDSHTVDVQGLLVIHGGQE